MPSFNVNVPHSIGKERATECIKSLLDAIRGKYGDKVKDVKEEWVGETLKFSFRTFGMEIAGDVLADEAAVRVEGTLPIMAMAFRGQIEGSIREELEKQLGKQSEAG